MDNSATTAVSAAAADKAYQIMTAVYGNPSSLHIKGMEAEHELTAARKAVAAQLKANPDEVFFTSGGTEANNTALFGAAYANARTRRKIIISAVEHSSVLDAAKRLEAEGFTVERLAPRSDGTVHPEDVAAATDGNTALVSVMLVNNETGAVMPVDEVFSAVKAVNPQTICHTDAVQAFGKLPVRAKALGADVISVSGHKVHAPKGVGALYVRPDLSLPAFLHGGGQEKNFRSGTEPLPAICAMGAACAAALPTLRSDIARQAQLRDDLIARLDAMEGVQVLGAHDAPHIVSCALPGIPSQNTINLLQEHGVFVSAGSACSRGKHSHVQEALGLPPEVIDGSIRVSLSRFTEPWEIDALVDGLEAVLTRMKR